MGERKLKRRGIRNEERRNQRKYIKLKVKVGQMNSITAQEKRRDQQPNKQEKQIK